ncbi:MAG: diguanylate cyclase [Archangium sp.]|nr:diguanylate cyclase [Archangium sp.]MDP3152542.1 diguanylate cyclase [Archangium sp.]MDP3572288.1 diguanylate cyclase [Archangium sp.]
MGVRWTALVVSDATSSGDALIRELEDAGAKVLTARTASEGFGHLIDGPIDVAIVDLDVSAELAAESGLSVLHHFRSEGGQTPVLLVSNTDDPVVRASAFGQGCDDYFVKPVAAGEVAARALRRMEVHQALRAAQAESERLHELAVTDGLTQVANHRHFQDRLREEFRRAQRYDDPLALILVDLDHFKNVNDSFGHQVGDAVLFSVAACVKAAVRETDFVARYGGEEFAVLLPKTHLAGALTVAERITAEMLGIKAGPLGLKVTASFGISGFPGRSVNTSEQLVRTADEALYRAKREGRNKISLFQATAHASAS